MRRDEVDIFVRENWIIQISIVASPSQPRGSVTRNNKGGIKDPVGLGMQFIPRVTFSAELFCVKHLLKSFGRNQLQQVNQKVFYDYLQLHRARFISILQIT